MTPYQKLTIVEGTVGHTLETIMGMMPVNSKRFKRDLRDLTPKELRVMMRLVDTLNDKLGRFSAPIEDELYHRTGSFR
jgi:hypothetical protein